eukprot:scaffold29236_cov120-Isochrysis_galbana.AAC.6
MSPTSEARDARHRLTEKLESAVAGSPDGKDGRAWNATRDGCRTCIAEAGSRRATIKVRDVKLRSGQ